jgi:hypothetical protein
LRWFLIVVGAICGAALSLFVVTIAIGVLLLFAQGNDDEVSKISDAWYVGAFLGAPLGAAAAGFAVAKMTTGLGRPSRPHNG